MQIAKLLAELSLGNSVAESDERLDRYFVDTYVFDALINGKCDIIAGDKGTGKTALYRILMKRQKSIDALNSTRVVTAFNLTGSPIFQQLLNIPQQTEGLYGAFWKTYFLSLVGNWLIDEDSIQAANKRRVQYFLEATGLKTIDTTPKGIFSKLIGLFPRTPVKAVELEFGLAETGLPSVKPKVEFSDATVVPPTNFFGIDYPTGLKLLEASLRESKITIWIAMDRLDEAFQGFQKIEVPALRALLRTYLDFKEISNVRLKLFLRNDLFRKIISGTSKNSVNFVNLTHINDRKLVISWDDDDLKHLLLARVRDTPDLVKELELHKLNNDAAFSSIFINKVSQGPKQSTTWNWIISRIRDGNDVIAPRNLIDLVEKAREAQLRSENRSPREYLKGMALIEADAIKKAHKLLSKTRVEDTLMAESADLVPLLDRFRNKKAEYDFASLRGLFNVSDDDEVLAMIQQLRDIGFLKEVGKSYKVPMLYREGFGIRQGKANGQEHHVVRNLD